MNEGRRRGVTTGVMGITVQAKRLCEREKDIGREVKEKHRGMCDGPL